MTARIAAVERYILKRVTGDEKRVNEIEGRLRVDTTRIRDQGHVGVSLHKDLKLHHFLLALIS